jgi:tyrosine-protein phosphatase SIW14
MSQQGRTVLAKLALAVAALVLAGMVAAQGVTSPRTGLPAAAGARELAGVGNFGVVGPHLWRGAQPTRKGLANLKSMGVTVVVNLRHDEDEVEGEQHVVEGLGMRYVAIPVSGMSTPTHEQVAAFLRLFVREPSDTVFVHCRRGADRTGVMIAAYRMTFDGWAAEQAIDEMKAFHFAYLLYPNMVSYVRAFPRALKELPLFAFLRH